MQEAEIRRTVVPGQPRQKNCETTSQWKKSGHGGPRLSSQRWQEALNRRIAVQAGWGKKQDLNSKTSRAELAEWFK
jgi:hypothetical protein